MPLGTSEKPHGTLIIGYGNPLRGDDGVGHAVVARLEEILCPSCTEEVSCLVSMQLTPEMAETLSTAKRAVFIDASVGIPKGKIGSSHLWPRPTPSSLGHHFTPESILQISLDLFGRAPKAYLLAIGVGSMEPGHTLTPEVAHAVERLAKHLRHWVRRWRDAEMPAREVAHAS